MTACPLAKFVKRPARLDFHHLSYGAVLLSMMRYKFLVTPDPVLRRFLRFFQLTGGQQGMLFVVSA